jgi:NAD(P)H-dependent FMN reductase
MSKLKVLGICGSASANSSNLELLSVIAGLNEESFEWNVTNDLRDFPLFRPEELEEELPPLVGEFKSQVIDADAIVIVTPEYTHNIPASLKNAIEWCTASGEFVDKPILPITFTPTEPRGKYAMQSLLESLKTLDAKVVTQLSLYKTDVEFDEYKINLPEEVKLMLTEALNLLI